MVVVHEVFSCRATSIRIPQHACLRASGSVKLSIPRTLEENIFLDELSTVPVQGNTQPLCSLQLMYILGEDETNFACTWYTIASALRGRIIHLSLAPYAIALQMRHIGKVLLGLEARCASTRSASEALMSSRGGLHAFRVVGTSTTVVGSELDTHREVVIVEPRKSFTFFIEPAVSRLSLERHGGRIGS